MRNLRCYYSASISDFLSQSNNEILGIIHANDSFSEIKLLQSNTWQSEISILKEELARFGEGRIIFEYTIPRMGKRVDVVILYNNIVFLLEFKCGDSEYRQSTYDQVLDYALDLKNFQKESHDKIIVPIVVSTEAQPKTNKIIKIDNILEPLYCNKSNIATTIYAVVRQFYCDPFDYTQWENSEYLPTPTIVEAAQALYRGHKVQDITRNDAGAKNLSVTTTAIDKVIEFSKTNKRKSICFVTGIPGAGKTLVGLNLAIEHSDAVAGEHAVFLSGNLPLVKVLQEALARDKVSQSTQNGQSITKKDALRSTNAFIQIIHKYRDSFVGNNNIPPERIAIFDEAQRAWTKQKIAEFMKSKKGVSNFAYSEPEFLISTLDRHNDWAVVVCLVGGGQEINSGEAGLPEWFDSLRKRFSNWDIYVAPQLNDIEYRRDYEWKDMLQGLNVCESNDFHLSTSIRSFRTPDLSAFVKALLDLDIDNAKVLYERIRDKYPIMLTRDLNEAKRWVKDQSRGTTRYGLLASSKALRLKSEGIFVKNKVSVADWFLNDKTDVRSSYYLEDVVTQFDIQGLELDYTVLAWDADLRIKDGRWIYNDFKGTRWNTVHKNEDIWYLKNAYRVLLTRARQGMAIYIPDGDDNDPTRKKAFYDETYNYLGSIMK